MKVEVTWAGKHTFVGTSESGHSIAFGGAYGDDGAKPGPSPMELLLLGTGGCSAYDVVMILERGREPVTDVRVEIEAERATTDPKVFVKLHLHFVIEGKGLNPAKVDRAVNLSIEKYCSASAMMAATATLTHDYEIVDVS